MVVRRHKLGEMEIECTLHNSIVLAIFLPKIIKVNGNLAKFWRKQFWLFFSETRCIHLYSSETLIAINNGNKFKQQKKTLQKNYDISAIIYKAAAAGGIFNIKLFNTIWPQLTWQLKTKVRLTVSYNLDVTRSEHLHKESVDNEI